MFGLLNLEKLLVLALIVLAVWYGFKLVGRLEASRKAEAKLRAREEGGAKRAAARKPEAEEMVKCPACKAYVPARGARSCGRADCPY